MGLGRVEPDAAHGSVEVTSFVSRLTRGGGCSGGRFSESRLVNTGAWNWGPGSFSESVLSCFGGADGVGVPDLLPEDY